MKDLPLNPAALDLEPPKEGLSSFPPANRWDDWTEYDPAQWPNKVEKHYSLIPTICVKSRRREITGQTKSGFNHGLNGWPHS